MAVDTAIAHFRRREQNLAALAGSTVEVTRPGESAGIFDYDTLTWSNPDDVVDVHMGPAIIRPATATASETDAAGQEISQGRWEVKVFDLDTVFELGDQVTVTASDQDPTLEGRVLTVKHIPHDDWLIARRLHCEEDRT